MGFVGAGEDNSPLLMSNDFDLGTNLIGYYFGLL